jgi:hypothetical protein
MSKRVLHFLGALLAAGVLIALPSAAQAGDPGGGCYDHNAPWSHYGNGWWHHDGNGRYWHGWGDGHGYFGGGSYDRGCDALHIGKVAKVKVAVAKMRDGKCRHLLGHSGRLSRPGSCATHHWMTAAGTRHWRFRIHNRLPHGRYRLHRRAIDSAGNHELPDVWHVRIR